MKLTTLWYTVIKITVKHLCLSMKENGRNREKEAHSGIIHVRNSSQWNDNENSYAPASFCGTAFMYVQFYHPDWLAVVKVNKTLLQRIARKNLIVVYEPIMTKIVLFKDVGHHVRSKPDICVAPSISCTFNLNSKLSKLIINFLIQSK